MLFSFTIEGNLASAPTVRTLPDGSRVTAIRLIHNQRFLKDGKWVDAKYPTVIDVSCWRGLGERTALLRKGDPVIAELSNLRAYIGGTNGQYANLAADARTLAISMRSHGASSHRATRPDAERVVRTADGEEFPIGEHPSARMAEPAFAAA